MKMFFSFDAFLVYPTVVCLLTGLLLTLSIKYLAKFCDKFTMLKKNEKFSKIAGYEKYIYLLLLDILLIWGIVELINCYFNATYNNTSISNIRVCFSGFLGVCILFCLIFSVMWKYMKAVKNSEKSMTSGKMILGCLPAIIFWVAAMFNVYLAIIILNFMCIAGLLSAGICAYRRKNKIYIKMVYLGFMILILSVVCYMAVLRLSNTHNILYDVFYVCGCDGGTEIIL